MSLRIVPLYAAALVPLFLLLSFRVIRLRRARRVAIGPGGVAELERAMRVHANFAEYAPFALLLLAMAELRGAPGATLHVLCLMLVIGRLLHAFGVSRPPEVFRLRVAGMMLTFATLVGAALAILAS